MAKEIIVLSPVDGKVVELNKVPDPVFAEKMIGDGVAVEPSNGEFVSPIKGKLATVFPTGHAFGIESKGAGILIHIGLETVELNGEGFDVQVTQGGKAKEGTLLVNVDLAILKKAKVKAITPVLVTNETLNGRKIEVLAKGTVKKGEPLFKIVG